MRTSLLLFLLLGSLESFGQTVSVLQKPIANRPVQLLGELKGKFLPVIAYEKNQPLVLQGDKHVRVDQAAVNIRGVWDVRSGLISVRLRSAFPESDHQLGPLIGDKKALEADFESDVDLQDVFAAVVVYQTLGDLLLGDSDVQIRGLEIGSVKAHEPQSLRIEFPKLRRTVDVSALGEKRTTLRWSLLIFSQGRQIATSLGSAASDYIVESLDRRLFEAAMRQRLKGKSPLAIFRARPFKFSEEVSRRYAGKVLQARVTVSPSGVMEKLEITDVDDVELRSAIESQLRDWLFFPPCENGTVDRGIAAIPVKF